MKKIIIFILGFFILCFSVTCRKKDDDDSCPVCPNISGFSQKKKKNGDTVTVAGENFTTNPEGLKLKATINGKDAVVAKILSDKQVKILVPDKCGTGPIRIYYDDELTSQSSAAFVYDRIGMTYFYAGKCGSNIENADPLLAEFTAPTAVFLDEPRGYVYALIADGKVLVRISSSGVKKIIETDPVIMRGGVCDASGNIYLAFDTHIARVDNSIFPSLTVVAGVSGTAGHADGKGAAARFNFVNDLLIDANNNMYIAENLFIRKMDVNTFNVTTLAGVNAAGYADGPALTAKFNSIVSIALDKNQNLYIADWENSRMRKLSNGVVSTIAGDGTAAVKNGIGTAAQLEKPRSVVVNNDATFLYFSDSFRSIIRKINLSNSEVSSFSGDLVSNGDKVGPVETALYFQPSGFTYSKTSDLFYIADYFNCKRFPLNKS